MSHYWQDMAVARLREYECLRRASKSIPTELARMQVAGAPGSDRRLDSLVAKRELRLRFLQIRQRLRQVERGLEVLTPQERLVLQMMYVCPQRGNLARLCQVLGCEKTTVYRRRDEALRRFTAALYSR